LEKAICLANILKYKNSAQSISISALNDYVEINFDNRTIRSLTSLLLRLTKTVTGSGLIKPVEQILIVVMALLLMPMVIAIL